MCVPVRGRIFYTLPDAGGVWTGGLRAAGREKEAYGRESIDIQAVGAGEGRAHLALSAPLLGHFAAALLCACLSMALNALTPQIIRITVDSILRIRGQAAGAAAAGVLPLETLRQEPVTALWWAAGAVMVTALLRGLCSFGQRAQLSRGSEAYVKGLRDDLYRRIQYLPFAWHKQHPTGDIIQRCTSDVDVIRTFVCNQLVEVVRTVFLIILYLWIMFRMNVKLSLIALAFIPIVGPVVGGCSTGRSPPGSRPTRPRAGDHLRSGEPHRRAGGAGLRTGEV